MVLDLLLLFFFFLDILLICSWLVVDASWFALGFFCHRKNKKGRNTLCKRRQQKRNRRQPEGKSWVRPSSDGPQDLPPQQQCSGTSVSARNRDAGLSWICIDCFLDCFLICLLICSGVVDFLDCSFVFDVSFSWLLFDESCLCWFIVLDCLLIRSWIFIVFFVDLSWLCVECSWVVVHWVLMFCWLFLDCVFKWVSLEFAVVLFLLEFCSFLFYWCVVDVCYVLLICYYFFVECSWSVVECFLTSAVDYSWYFVDLPWLCVDCFLNLC